MLASSRNDQVLMMNFAEPWKVRQGSCSECGPSWVLVASLRHPDRSRYMYEKWPIVVTKKR